MAVSKERRVDALSRSEFIETMERFEGKMDSLSGYQRDANGKIATAFEKLATLEERSQNQKDAPARVGAIVSMLIAVIAFILGLAKATVH